MADGTFTFVSWLRRGLATEVNTQAGALSTTTEVAVTVTSDVEVFSPLRPLLDLIGPGDIVGLDPSVVARTWPKANDLDAEFVSYPLIEFDQADLPWRYSPEPSPAGATQVRPWFSLIVLKASECSLAPPSAAQRLPVVTVNDPAVLPTPSDLWAWAHTQFEGTIDPATATGPDELRSRITGNPGLFTARVMSPRLLVPNTDYIACLVPTFERGRLLGLGRLKSDSTDPNENPPVLNLWRREDVADGGFKLPAYFSWAFRTGTIGDFEQVARQIKPFALPASVGRRDLDVGRPGFELPKAASSSLPVEGALMSVAASKAPAPQWNATERAAFIHALATLLNSATDPSNHDPRLVPPLYGQWYAADGRLNDPNPTTNPLWFHELNSDPRGRVAAALGTAVIQNEQQALLASGWDQVDEIRDVNDALRTLQLARGTLGRIFERHFLTVDVQRLYQLTLRLHAWVTCGSNTVCGHVDSSSIVPGFLSTQWLRFTARRGALGRFQGRPTFSGATPDLLHLLAACKKPAPEPPDPPVHEPKDPRGIIPCDFIDVLIGQGSTVTLFWGLVILWTVRKLTVTQSGDCWWIALKALRYAITLIEISISGEDVRRRCRYQHHGLTIADFQSAPPMPNFTPFSFVPATIPLPTIPGPPGADNTDAAGVRAALIRLLQRVAPHPASLCPPTPMDVDHCFEELRVKLDPTITVGTHFTERLDLGYDWNPRDRLQPLFAAPEYERPMYLPLSEISFDWILPGLGETKRDSISLAVTNQRFIEAYMAGLNHEMTRELLWNEFPTDQRGTYFRQFWDVAACISEGGSPLPASELRDVLPLRQWDRTKGLGLHSPRPGGAAGLLVLVVRAQLIQKYPNVIVYVQKRVGNRLDGAQRRPVFYALLGPDMAFYGFNMTVDDLQDDDYFVLQEQPGDPKFADEFTVPTEERSDNTRYSSPGAVLGQTAGAIAQKTFLEPFRIGFQARSMLPESA